MSKYLTIGQAADRLGLQVDTVRKLERAGKIRAVRTTGGHRRFPEAEVDRLQKSRRGRGKTPQKRNPSTGEFAGYDAVFANDQYELDEELTMEDWDAEELASYQAPPPPRPTPAPPKPEVFPAIVALKALTPVGESEFALRCRMINIKAIGRLAVPWGTPGEWLGKVVTDLERFVTPAQFPADLPMWNAGEIVRARVEAVLKPWREAEENAKRAKQAEADAARQKMVLIAHGNEYARKETTDWDWSPRNDARAEVGKVLTRDIKPDWTEHEVENAVDDVLDQWDDDEDDDEDEY